MKIKIYTNFNNRNVEIRIKWFTGFQLQSDQMSDIRHQQGRQQALFVLCTVNRNANRHSHFIGPVKTVNVHTLDLPLKWKTGGSYFRKQKYGVSRLFYISVINVSNYGRAKTQRTKYPKEQRLQISTIWYRGKYSGKQKKLQSYKCKSQREVLDRHI